MATGSQAKSYAGQPAAYEHFLDTNNESQGIRSIKVPIAAVTSGTQAFAIENPIGASCIVHRVALDVTTVASGAATMDVGVAANATTSSDTLLDGVDVHSGTALFDSGNAALDSGANAKLQTWSTTEYVTGTSSASLAGIVGYVTVWYSKR